MKAIISLIVAVLFCSQAYCQFPCPEPNATFLLDGNGNAVSKSADGAFHVSTATASLPGSPNSGTWQYDDGGGRTITGTTISQSGTYTTSWFYNLAFPINGVYSCGGSWIVNVVFDNSPLITVSSCSNGYVVFSVNNAVSFSNYQWYKDGSPIPGANTSTYEIQQAGEYYVTANGPVYNSSLSNSIIINNPYSFNISQSGALNCGGGGSATITAGTTFDAYYWYKNGQLLQTEYTGSITITAPGTYHVRKGIMSYQYSCPLKITGGMNRLQSSGPISLSDINVALGRPFNSSGSSLNNQVASSDNQVSKSPPFKISSFYNYCY